MRPEGIGAEKLEEVLVFARHPALRVAALPGKGRGVIVAEAVPAGILLERSPVLPVSEVYEPGHSLFPYLFAWGAPPAREAVGLGLVSLVNHSPQPTGTIKPDHATQSVGLYALQDVAAGTEITIDYDCALWFEPEP